MSAIGVPKKCQLGSGKKEDGSLFLDCFRGVIKHTEYWNKWIVNKCWIRVINERYDMSEPLRFTVVQLNNVISRNPVFKAAKKTLEL